MRRGRPLNTGWSFSREVLSRSPLSVTLSEELYTCWMISFQSSLGRVSSPRTAPGQAKYGSAFTVGELARRGESLRFFAVDRTAQSFSRTPVRLTARESESQEKRTLQYTLKPQYTNSCAEGEKHCPRKRTPTLLSSADNLPAKIRSGDSTEASMVVSSIPIVLLLLTTRL
jgi:hypothetical protein